MTGHDAAEGNPALAAATQAILNRRLAASHSTGDQDSRRAAILLDALPDAAAALEAAVPLLRERLVAETADQVMAVAQETVLEAVATSTARIAELEAALAGVLSQFTKSDAGWRARISGTDLARLQATADGRADHG